MNMTRRTCALIFLGLALLLSFLFRSFVLDNFVRPLALVLWVFWRVLLSVDQRLYWGVLIISALVYVFIRVGQELTSAEHPLPLDPNVTMDTVDYWQLSVRLAAEEIDKPDPFQRNLGSMLATMYALKQPDAPQWVVHDALRQRQIPLPEPIHAFLFPAEPVGGKRSFWQLLRAIWHTPKKWTRRWTGRDVAEYYQAIDQVLTLMESTMEINNDKYLDISKH
jgi:hypothetical protein